MNGNLPFSRCSCENDPLPRYDVPAVSCKISDQMIIQNSVERVIFFEAELAHALLGVLGLPWHGGEERHKKAGGNVYKKSWRQYRVDEERDEKAEERL